MVLKKGQNDELSKQMKEILVTDMFIIYPVYHIRNKWELIVLIHGTRIIIKTKNYNIFYVA